MKMGNEPKSNKSRSSAAKPTFRFVNYSLSASDRDELTALDCEIEFPHSTVEQLVMAGYKYSVSRDDKHSCYVASLTDRMAGSPFENACLTGRGESPANARSALLYRHFNVASEDWSAFGTSEPSVPNAFD